MHPACHRCSGPCEKRKPVRRHQLHLNTLGCSSRMAKTWRFRLRACPPADTENQTSATDSRSARGSSMNSVNLLGVYTLGALLRGNKNAELKTEAQQWIGEPME